MDPYLWLVSSFRVTSPKTKTQGTSAETKSQNFTIAHLINDHGFGSQHWDDCIGRRPHDNAQLHPRKKSSCDLPTPPTFDT